MAAQAGCLDFWSGVIGAFTAAIAEGRRRLPSKFGSGEVERAGSGSGLQPRPPPGSVQWAVTATAPPAQHSRTTVLRPMPSHTARRCPCGSSRAGASGAGTTSTSSTEEPGSWRTIFACRAPTLPWPITICCPLSTAWTVWLSTWMVTSSSGENCRAPGSPAPDKEPSAKLRYRPSANPASSAAEAASPTIPLAPPRTVMLRTGSADVAIALPAYPQAALLNVLLANAAAMRRHRILCFM
mmetsp:Transcript_72108/g.233287  ORF Transcript_72108/g.233287 Transcript_72108/m.233287 type:complete len:240 (-) Transcript_72108:1374-2093(-)